MYIFCAHPTSHLGEVVKHAYQCVTQELFEQEDEMKGFLLDAKIEIFENIQLEVVLKHY